MTHIALHVSLGHNSSAAMSVNNIVVTAFEQERLDRVKSSSAYPRDAIARAMRHYDKADVAYVGHWFSNMNLQTNKYLDLKHLESCAREIVTLNHGFTHHDSHAHSASMFLDCNGRKTHEKMIVVLDGFGTNQECFSVYDQSVGSSPSLRFRTFGFDMSLGLMYQYVTEYLGLRAHRDEYKLLGYESHIQEHATMAEIENANVFVSKQAMRHCSMMLSRTVPPPPTNGSLIDFDALRSARLMWSATAQAWDNLFQAHSVEGSRACIAYCAQLFIEICAINLIKALLPKYGPRPTLVLTGGCHYNVKLNRAIQRALNIHVFSHPLAGDQGAAMGLNPNLRLYGLDLGERVLGLANEYPDGVHVIDESAWPEFVAERLIKNEIVNVVRGDMEFGPRALCNTTTFALPSRENVKRINYLNDRDDAMPMAPVMTEDAARHWLKQCELSAVHPSERFMITTCAFTGPPPDRLAGVSHRDPLRAIWTARPQVASTRPLNRLLSLVPDHVLINTSFNYHGEPIVYSEQDALRTHTAQHVRAAKSQGAVARPTTVIVKTPRSHA